MRHGLKVRRKWRDTEAYLRNSPKRRERADRMSGGAFPPERSRGYMSPPVRCCLPAAGTSSIPAYGKDSPSSGSQSRVGRSRANYRWRYTLRFWPFRANGTVKGHCPDFGGAPNVRDHGAEDFAADAVAYPGAQAIFGRRIADMCKETASNPCFHVEGAMQGRHFVPLRDVGDDPSRTGDERTTIECGDLSGRNGCAPMPGRPRRRTPRCSAVICRPPMV